MKNSISKKLFSLFFGMWIAFTLTQPVTAQWTVNINSDFSPTTIKQIALMTQQLGSQVSIATDSKASKIQQALEYVKTAQRWIKTIEQHTQKMIGDLKRFTSMKGILKSAEQSLGLSKDTLQSLADIGELIRGSYTLKNQFLSLVRTRLNMIKSLDQRARRGIFNPQADLEDIEEYLRYSIGREASQRLATLNKLKESDPLLEQFYYNLEKVRAEKAALIKELEGIKEKLDKEGSFGDSVREIVVDDDGQTQTNAHGRRSLSPEGIQTLVLRRGQLEEQIARLTEREESFLKEIQERYALVQKTFDNAYTKGRYWNLVLAGWSDFEHIKKEQLEQMIDLYGSTDTPPIVPTGD